MARDIKQFKRAVEDLSGNLQDSNNYGDYYESLRIFCDTLRYNKLAQAYYGCISLWRVLDESYRNDQYCMREVGYTLLEVLLSNVERSYGREARNEVKETITGNW